MQLGFFEEEVKIIESKKVIKPRIKKEPVFNCTKCGLSQSCKSPQMAVHGKGKLSILIIGEYPGQSDDKNNKQFTGEVGRLLKEIINELGYDLYQDFYTTNAVRCFPGLDKDKVKLPKPIQIASCRKFLLKDIEETNPKVIIPLGKLAVDGLIGHRLSGRISNTTITDWAGLNIPDQELKRYICPSWNLQMILRGNNQTDVVLYKQLKAHIKKAIELAEKPFYISNYGSEIISITAVKEATDIVKRITENKVNEAIAFDYEATGIKPYRKGHEIVCASVSDGLFAYSFPFFNDEEFRTAWKELMQSDVNKIIHNSKYENIWTKIRSGFNNKGSSWIKNIISDTMLDAHIIHNQKKVNLKFWVYAKFGVLGYDSEIDPYLECSKEEKDKYGANGFNRIKEFPIEKLLTYNGLDSFFTYKLWEIQQTELNNLTRQGSEFFLESSFELSKAENNGMLLDTENAKLEFKRLTRKLNKIESGVRKSEEIKKWDKTKNGKPVEFALSNTNHLTHLLFNCMKVKYDKNNITSTGRPKGDIEALGKYDDQIVKDVLLWRKYKKVRDTNLNGFIKEGTDSIIHTSLNLHVANTYRSSSNDPNLQNVPVREIETMQLLRKLIIARPGHKLGEYDYKAMEAVINAIYNKDPNWIRYVTDASTDMHRDMAAKIYIRKKAEVLKSERQTAKSNFVFATVYGSYWKNTAVNLWNECDEETRVHLKSKGVRNINDMREHMKKVEAWFWEQFPVGYEYKEKTLRDYEKKGYIDLLTGFRCYGPMTRNKILNYRVQGTASHCKLWALKNISQLMQKKKMNSKILLEIHDSILPDIDPAEEDYLDYQMWLYGTQKIRENFEWLIVPLFIEKKVSKLNGNWAEMENKGLLTGEYFNA